MNTACKKNKSGLGGGGGSVSRQGGARLVTDRRRAPALPANRLTASSLRASPLRASLQRATALARAVLAAVPAPALASAAAPAVLRSAALHWFDMNFPMSMKASCPHALGALKNEQRGFRSPVLPDFSNKISIIIATTLFWSGGIFAKEALATGENARFAAIETANASAVDAGSGGASALQAAAGKTPSGAAGTADGTAGAGTAGAGTSGTAPKPGFLEQFFPFILIGLVFYFLLIRPQQRKARLHESFLGGLKKGDEVITASGLFGKIEGMTDRFVILEIAEKTRVRVLRSKIASLIKDLENPAGRGPAGRGAARQNPEDRKPADRRPADRRSMNGGSPLKALLKKPKKI